MQPSPLDELDRRLIHCLQISPRAPWAALSPILGADPVTLARRWHRLTGEGIVYATAVDKRADDLVFAFVEIVCAPSGIASVVDVLVKDPAVTTIDRVAGRRDLMATVAAENVDVMAQWSSATIAPLGQITSIRLLLVADLVADARAWRIRALKAREVAAVQALDSKKPSVSLRLGADERTALVGALAEDFRAPAAHLAARLGLPQRRVREVLQWLLAGNQLAIRLDVARAATDWPIYVWYFLRTPPSTLDRVTSRLSKLPEMRVVAKTVGSYNVVLATWLRTLHEVQRLEAVIESALPDVHIEDRALVLRTEKHVGHVLDERGLGTGSVVPFVPVPAR